MAQLDTNDGGGKKKKGGSKQKKVSVHVDFTPMVDMNMLLITFFMLCTSLSKPQTMEIVMPTNKAEDQTTKNDVKESEAITVICTGHDSIFYYEGKPDASSDKLKLSSYNADGFRAYLLRRNIAAVSKIDELTQKKKNLQIKEADFKKQVSELKSAKGTPTVVIKASDNASYKNLIDVLDEMSICSIGKYAIVKFDNTDRSMIANLRAKGAH